MRATVLDIYTNLTVIQIFGEEFGSYPETGLELEGPELVIRPTPRFRRTYRLVLTQRLV